ncbi:hypothetical protein A176_007071 [Myxococcus hansupus]|uniref:Zinc-finger domain-containing protein n=1 Tax=Pseudomyxococcus hansupus TaxID=1297742 RepID=A0A0H4X4L8_9BACT|nr:hypothetical protein [Myxococcus hansupus]AKQ70159.1 hypothetical protein A176_007071 [Myxococcus hansupus]
MSPPCDLLPLVDRHFSARITPPDERRMREHLQDCAHCRERYERQLLLARLDPSAPDARTRLARGLGLEARRPASFWQRMRHRMGAPRESATPARLAPGGAARNGTSVPDRPALNPDTSAAPTSGHPVRGDTRPRSSGKEGLRGWLLAPVAVAGLALLVVRLPSASTDPLGFTARGAGNAAAQARLLAYAVAPGGHTRLLGPTLRPEQELAFAFRNPDAHRFLMVFARDASGRVHWYHPGWTDEASNPSAIPIPAGDTLRELPEAISHPLVPGPLTLHAVFLESPLTVKQMESLVARGDLEAVLPAGAESLSLQLQVTP